MESNRIADGFQTLEGGMDSGRNPSLLERNKVAYAQNVRFRGGYPKNRPGIKKLNLMFRKPVSAGSTFEQTDTAVQTLFESGKFQGATFYSWGFTQVIFVVIGGRFFTIELRESVSTNVGGVQVTGHRVRELDLIGTTFQDVTVANYTVLTTANFTAPAIGSTVLVSVPNTTGVQLRTTVLVNGVRWIVTATTATTLALKNLSVTAATVINSGATVVADGYAVPAIGSNFTIGVSTPGTIDTTYSTVSLAGKTYTIQSLGTVLTLRNDSETLDTLIPASTRLYHSIKGVNDPSQTRVYFCQAEQFLIIQDGQSKPAIFDGATLRRAEERDAKGQPEIPVGTVMAYGNGRLWVAILGSYFLAGDIVGGPSGSREYGFNDAVIKFSENTYLNEGGFFRVPSQAGDITAMIFSSTPDTSLGQGPLQVFTRTHCFSVNVPVDRDAWKNVQYPIQTVTFVSNGALGDKSTVLVNGDIFYRAKDGIRSMVIARREMGQWGNTPLSNEVSRLLDNDTQHLLQYSSAVVFDNRLIMTTAPVPLANGCYHQGLVTLDFHPISAMGSRSSPAYDGLWNIKTAGASIDIYQIFTGVHDGDDRCFIMARDTSNLIELWELTKNERFDYNGTTTAVRIDSFIETASLDFGFALTSPQSSAMQFKELVMGELWADDVAGEVDFTVQYRPDQSPTWVTWHGWEKTETFRNCNAGCRPIECYNPGYLPRMRLPGPPEDSCNTSQTKLSRYGYEFQFKVMWEGSCRLKKLRLQAIRTQEDTNGECLP
jgi:hypothetical protein